MSEQDAPSATATLDPGLTSEGQAIIKNATLHENLNQNVIIITEDKAELILMKRSQAIEHRKMWHTPLGIFITLTLIILTTDKFKNAFSIPASVWQAIVYVAACLSLFWLLYAIYKYCTNKEITISTVISELKNQSDKMKKENSL